MSAADAFRAAVEAKDIDGALATLDPGIRFFSPAKHRPFEGRDMAGAVLRLAAETFEDFRYTAFVEGTPVSVLRFEARIGGLAIEGVDVLTEHDGLVTELAVMLRPINAATAFVEEMGRKVAALGA